MLFHCSILRARGRARFALPVLLLTFMLILAACNNEAPAATGTDAPAPPIAATPVAVAEADAPEANDPEAEDTEAEDTEADDTDTDGAETGSPEVEATPAPAGEAAPAPTSESPANAAVGAETRTFRIVPEASQASYAVEEEFFNRAVRFVTAVGRTSAIQGELNLAIGDASLALGDNHFTVDLRTLTSDSGQRDRRIRNEWLESNAYPWAEFRATEVRNFPTNAAEGRPIEFELMGNLTIREVTQPVTFATTAQLDGDTLTATAVTQIFMRDFGFEPPSILGMLTVTDGVTVTVELAAQAAE